MSMPKIPLSVLAVICSNIQKEKQLHLDHAAYFNRQFNQEKSRSSDPLNYSDLQKYYQLEAQKHMQQVFALEAKIAAMDATANTELFD